MTGHNLPGAAARSLEAKIASRKSELRREGW
jgi:hypothetical protein